MFAETLASFRNSCINSRVLPVDLSIKLQDINAKAGKFKIVVIVVVVVVFVVVFY